MKNYTIIVALLLCSNGAFGVRNKMPSTKVQLARLSGLATGDAIEGSYQDAIAITKKHEKYPNAWRSKHVVITDAGHIRDGKTALHEAKPKRSRGRYNNRMNIRP